jgi:molybdate transport system substrate-binding protein
VFAAASLTDAFRAAAVAFEADHAGVDVELNLAGSPTLREQVQAGAPADVFASASEADMDPLVEAGETAGDPRLFARNALEIVVPAGNPGHVDALGDFDDAGLLIGLCAPEVPCGALARRALTDAGVTPSPDTEEPDVRSVLSKVAAGELDAGIVYRTDVRDRSEVEGIDIPDDLAVTTDYRIAVLAERSRAEVAEAFVTFVLGSEGQRILAAHGFGPP